MITKYEKVLDAIGRALKRVYKLTVNYDLSIAELLEQGKYNWKNDRITDRNFPSTEKGQKEREFKLFHFNRYISSEDAIAEMKKRGI